MRLAVITLIMMLSISIAAYCRPAKEGSHPMTVIDLVRIKNIGDIAVSSTGGKIAFEVHSADLKESAFKSQIYVVVNGKAARFTESDEGEHSPQWSPNGDYLAFLSRRSSEEDEDQLWVMAASGGEARKITEEAKGVRDFEWGQDGRSIYYLAPVSPPEPLGQYKKAQKKKKYDGKVRDRERPGIAIHKVEIEKEEDEIVYPGDPGIEGFAISPDGNFAAFTSNLTGDPDDEDRRDIFVLSLKDGKARRLTEDKGCRTQIHWSPDSKAVAYTRFIEPDFDFSRGDIFITALSGGNTQNLTGKYDIEVMDFSWASKSGDIFFRGAKGVYTPIYRIRPDSGNLEKVTGDDADYTRFGVSSDGETIICAKEDEKHAPEIYHLQIDGKLKVLSDFNSHIGERSLAAQEVIRWKSEDGREIEGVLVKPHLYEQGKKYPLIVVIHGGPFGRVVNTLQDREFQLFAAEGYLVFAPNYRGSLGYGLSFSTEIRGAIMEKEFADVMSGIDQLISNNIANADQIGITGGSYGGYMTNWALARSDRFKAGVALYGITSLISDMSNSVYPSFEKDYIGKWYWESLEPYLKGSPFMYVQDVKAPLLLLHGDEDTNTFPSNSIEMYTALKKQGRIVELVQYPREGHGFEEPNHLIDAYERALEWFDRYLKGEKLFYRPGSEVRHKGKTLRVTSVKRVKEYSGITPKGEFIEIDAIMEREEDSSFVSSLSLSGEVHIVTEGGDRFYPVGIPVNILGERILVKGNELGYEISCTIEKGKKALPIALTFEIPKNEYRLTLFVQDFPPVRVYIWEE